MATRVEQNTKAACIACGDPLTLRKKNEDRCPGCKAADIYKRVQNIREIYRSNDFVSVRAEIDLSMVCPTCGGSKLPSSSRCFLCFRGDTTTPREGVRSTHPCLACGKPCKNYEGSYLCRKCRYLSWKVLYSDFIAPKMRCPSCGGRKVNAKAKTCRKCHWERLGISIVLDNKGRRTSARRICARCGSYKSRPDSKHCGKCYQELVKPEGVIPIGRCIDCDKKVKNKAIRCRPCKDRVIANH